jgi:lactoylglutathione lyase
MPGTGINHVSISAVELEESVSFYEHVFGMQRIPTYDFGFPVQYMSLGMAQLHIFVRPTEVPTFHHFSINVDDFDTVYARVEAMDAFDPVPFGAHAYELPDGAVQVYVRDPGANLVEINWPDIGTISPAIRARFGRLSDRVPQAGEALNATLFRELHPDLTRGCG